jgi:hypothetical protein
VGAEILLAEHDSGVGKAKEPIDFDTVREIGLGLPDVEEGTAYGSPALRVQGRLLACVPVNASAEPASLMVTVDIDERAELLAADPDTYYVTGHYAGYEAVLVRLSRVDRDALQGLLGLAHKFVSGKVKKPATARRRAKSR